MPFLGKQSFQDWLLAIVSAVTIAFIGHVWASQTPQPAITIAGTTARALGQSNQWGVQFTVHNRGDAPAQNLRVRILSAPFDAPDRLQVNEDFTLANELDPGADMIRVYTTPRGPAPAEENPSAPAAPAAAKAPPPAGAPAAAGRAAAIPASAPPPPPPPARAPQSYVLVLQADYPAGGLFGGAAHRRWYYYYREGDNGAIQLGQPMKQRMEEAADRLLP